ncbi:tetratricopeptide repeat protein [Saccharicrinis sp. FJH54]|uniref:tetratricopeptide repeat protein n=1 Tax=Saccharicrinis sp. FJH54 TaxID=3344665 RepID=UPI0035D4396D
MIKQISIYTFLLILTLSSCKTVEKVAVVEQAATHQTKLSKENQRKFDYFFIEANRFKLNGDLERAAKMLSECLSIDPKSAATYFELGKLYLASQDVKNAIKNIKTAADYNSDNEWYRYYLAGLYEQNKDYDNATLQYRILTQKFPNKQEYKYHLAALLTQQKKYKDAIAVYDELEKENGISEPVSLEKHNLYLQANDLKGAIQEIENLKNEYPNQPRYHVLLGDAYIDGKDYKKALKEYNRAIAINPDYGPVHMSLAGYYDILNEPEKSQQELVKAFESTSIPFENKLRILVQYMMQTTKDSTKTENLVSLVNIMLDKHPNEPDLHYYYGNFLLSQNQKEDALEQFKQVVELDPSRYETWLQIAGFYLDDQDWKKVIETADHAIDAQPAMPQAYLYKGIGAFQDEDYKTALNAFLKGAVYSPADNKDMKGQFYSNIGDTYYKLGESKDAFEYYDKALQLDDHNLLVLNNYSYYLSLEGHDLDKALEMSSKCVELEPKNSTYLDTYAWILYKKGNYSMAKYFMEQAVDKLTDDNGEVFEHYGDILFKTGDKDKAMEWWKKAKASGYDSPELDKKIESGELVEL